MNVSRATALRLIATSEFRPMSAEADFFAFAGVQSDEAFIAESELYTIILDGDRICLINEDGEEAQFELSENIFA